MKRSKNYKAASALIEKGKWYSIPEAVELVKKTSTVKFDATVDLSLHLNVDPRQADQQVRGTLTLPHGNGKTKRVLAVTDKFEEATNAGADFVGGVEVLERIQKENWFDYDVIVATPNMMGELGKLGRLLGPKGLMPNPKTGTVTNEIGKAITEIKGGRIEYRVDRTGNMHLLIGRVSFSESDLEDNLRAVIDTVNKARPAAVKGTFIKTAVLSTTMGPAVKFYI
ncbi:MAG: 50S ribosomal protein L1 [Coprobacillus sp.]|nr:50S ribosomal protein L1 [Coprobacillus sp.]